MNITIAMCDDQQTELDELKELVVKAIAPLGANAVIDEFSSGEELLNELLQGKKYQVYILDIEMPGIDGFKTAFHIREYHKTELVIFATRHPDKMQAAFEVDSFCNIKKPPEYAKVFDVMKKVIEYVKNQKSKFTFNSKGQQYSIDIGDIYYFEADNRIIRIYTTEGVHSFYSTLKDILGQVNKSFFARPHLSYIINFEWLESHDGRKITMRDGKEINIGETYLAGFDRAYANFLDMRI